MWVEGEGVGRVGSGVVSGHLGGVGGRHGEPSWANQTPGSSQSPPSLPPPSLPHVEVRWPVAS